VIVALLARWGLPQWLAEALCGALAVVLLFGVGYHMGHAAAAEDAELATAQAQHQHDAEMAELQNKGEQLQEHYEALQRQKQQVVYQTLTKEIPRVTTVYIPAPGAAELPLPRCVFTAGFVGVWNAALDPGVRAAAAGPDGAAGAADPAAASGDELDSGVTQAELLTNHDANAQACDGMRDQLNAILDYEAERQKVNE
jgi:hypothetical protein